MKRAPAIVLVLVTVTIVGIFSVAILDRVIDPFGTHPKSEAKPFAATVVRFNTIPSRWHTDKMILTASAPDGRTGQGVISVVRIYKKKCKVGDPVEAHMVGSVMVVDALTCGQVAIR